MIVNLYYKLYVPIFVLLRVYDKMRLLMLYIIYKGGQNELETCKRETCFFMSTLSIILLIGGGRGGICNGG